MNTAASRSARRAYIAQLRVKRIFWICLFVVIALFPLVVAAINNTTNGTWRAVPREIGSFAGMLGLSLMILSFIPIMREKKITSAFNLDVVYKFHHSCSILGFWLVVFHLVALWINNQEIGRLVNIFADYPLYMKAGPIALLAAGCLVYFSYFRKELKLNYDYWKIGHSLVAILMVVFGLIHTFGVNYYTGNALIHGYYVFLTVLAAIAILWLRVFSSLSAMCKPYVIREVLIRNNATTELRLEFAGKGNQKPIRYHAGQIAWITVRHSRFSFKEHPFSIASSDVDQNKIGFAIRELGDFTATIKDLKPGEIVYVEGGFGIFNPYILGDEGFVLIAGGIGIAPVMGILRSMADRKDRRHVVLYYGSRDKESIGFYDELNELSKKLNLEVVHVLEKTDDPSFEKGYVTKDVIERHYPKNKDRYDVFICGPGPMVQIVLPALKKIGIPKENIWPEFYDMA
ncbi:MAG TPA: ferric reductase-like transmembrane domain-containing protein [Flexilinea sp.]|nr:ferric reductase-like transmembrane domain-containing protein [Flexilinea sp.]